MRNAFADEVSLLAAEDDRVVLLSGDIGNRLFDRLKSQFPDRFLNCGVAEQNMMGVAAGMGLAGLRPIVYTITPFTTTRCLEQIRVDVAYHESPVVIVGTGSGLSYASLGPTHHSLEDFAIFRAIPNMQVFAPWDSNSLRSVLRQAIASARPSYIRIGKKGEPEIAPFDLVPPIGNGLSLRGGTDLCVIAVGTVAGEAITAAEQLAAEGIHAEVVLAHTIKPFPIRLFDDLLSRHSTIITIEEHSRIGGFGESLLSHAGTHGIAQQIYVLGASDEFMPTVGSQRFARDYFGLNSKTIVEVARRALKQC